LRLVPSTGFFGLGPKPEISQGTLWCEGWLHCRAKLANTNRILVRIIGAINAAKFCLLPPGVPRLNGLAEKLLLGALNVNDFKWIARLTAF
jgi:hypothetical protein